MTDKAHPPSVNNAAALFDEMLVVLVQKGDSHAGERLFQRWNRRLIRAARRYCGSEDGAHDLAQDCWVAIWKGLGTLRDPARFRSYAFAVLHRRGASRLRDVIREREAAPDPLETALPASQSESAAITQAFTALPPDQRLAAHLHFVEGLTLREIAEVQSIAEGTAKSRLFHARRKLKAALDPSPQSQGELQ
ncbi:RNA polymerase sigma factor [uncultured Erythrobacter sp.]|uniref:RNA polymerase sigma factor n=1 Tax=uncultured Erythrobacter sp. TaxID=263913 RepID=UPI002635D8C9|nr:RNA polymerase sigma factor [uncultured Erythrobacter sp.]